MTDLFFLIVMRVVAVPSAEDDGTRESVMTEFAVGAFVAVGQGKSRVLQVGDELSDFSRHCVSC